jgi:hypothetical protein
MFYGMIRRAGRYMEIKTNKFKEWDYWYDEQCKGNNREVKMALKEYKRRHGENRSSYYSSKKEYVNFKKKQTWQEKKSEQMSYLINQKDARKMWVTAF